LKILGVLLIDEVFIFLVPWTVVLLTLEYVNHYTFLFSIGCHAALLIEILHRIDQSVMSIVNIFDEESLSKTLNFPDRKFT
jgi:hypothetical protein